MRKIGFLIRNVYRILVVKPNGKRRIYNNTEELHSANEDRTTDVLCKRIITADDCHFEPDHELQKMLEQLVAKNGSASYLARNSMVEFLLPLFSLKHIELKMAAITLVLVLALGIGPTGNHSMNRELIPIFLADTLIDSSLLHVSAVYDSASKVQR